jgi:hypothetical protein
MTSEQRVEQAILINDILPADAAIGVDKDNRWSWSFRCVDSEEIEDSSHGFDTPLEALLDFTKFLIKGSDELMDLKYENLDEEDE